MIRKLPSLALGPGEERLLAETIAKLESRAPPSDAAGVKKFLQTADPAAVRDAMRFLCVFDRRTFTADMLSKIPGEATASRRPYQLMLPSWQPEMRQEDVARVRGTMLEYMRRDVDDLKSVAVEMQPPHGEEVKSLTNALREGIENLERGEVDATSVTAVLSRLFRVVVEQFPLPDARANPWGAEAVASWHRQCEMRQRIFDRSIQLMQSYAAALAPDRLAEFTVAPLPAEQRPESSRVTQPPAAPRMNARALRQATIAADLLGRVAARDAKAYPLMRMFSRLARKEGVDARDFVRELTRNAGSLLLKPSEAELLADTVPDVIKATVGDGGARSGALEQLRSLVGEVIAPGLSHASLGTVFHRISLNAETTTEKRVRLHGDDFDVVFSWRHENGTWVMQNDAVQMTPDGVDETPLESSRALEVALTEATLALAQIRRVVWSKDGSLHKVELDAGGMAFVRRPINKPGLAILAANEQAYGLLARALGAPLHPVTIARETPGGAERTLTAEIVGYQTLAELGVKASNQALRDFAPDFHSIAFIDLAAHARDLTHQNIGTDHSGQPVAADREASFTRGLSSDLEYLGDTREIAVDDELRRRASALTQSELLEVMAPSKLPTDRVLETWQRLQYLVHLADEHGGKIPLAAVDLSSFAQFVSRLRAS